MLGLSLGFALGGRATGKQPFNPAQMSFDAAKSKDVSAQIGSSLAGLAFKPDGTEFTAIQAVNPRGVYRWTGATADNLSTATYASVFPIATGTVTRNRWGSSGTKGYYLSAGTSLNRFSVSPAYSTSWSFDSGQSFNFNTYFTTIQGYDFSADGTKLFLCGDPAGGDPQNVGGKIIGFTLSTPWAINTGVTRAPALDLDVNATLSSVNNFRGLRFANNGLQLNYISGGSLIVRTVEMSTAYDPSTGVVAAAKQLYIGDAVANPTDLEFSTDGKYLYIADNSATKSIAFFG